MIENVVAACRSPSIPSHPLARAGVAAALLVLAGAAAAAQFTINGPAGSGEFGRSVTVLPNGNIVVTDPGFDAPGPIADVGAVYLLWPNGTVISTLTGSSASDRVGSGGVVVLDNGNYVVISPLWSNGSAGSAGAVTFRLGSASGTSTVSPANSLVGGTAGDDVGNVGVTALGNGNYVVRSRNWNNGAIGNAGAVTFGSGTSGVTGVVSAANSLVGGTANDQVGNADLVVLANGNYVVASPAWDHGQIVDAGAATFGSGTSGISGVVSSANSLVGGAAGDQVGLAVTALANGNYVVRTPTWDNGALTDVGAATFGSGTSGISGVVSSTNSLVGSTPGDTVGTSVTALANGNYVVRSPSWNNGATTDVGAATFGSGTSGISGVVSPANSLVGSTAGDMVGNSGIIALGNGNYVVRSQDWDAGATVNVGAVTFGSGTSGITGVVSSANSLVGSTAGDTVGTGVAALSNGNYVVASRFWDNGATANAGAATFGPGTSGISGTISPANSLVGSTASDQVGFAVTALDNGNYVVRSSLWNDGATADVGAATFGSGTSGITGAVSPANSLVGSTAGDQVGLAVTALGNGNYVVASRFWDNGATANAGAVTFASGTSGITGAVSPANSLVGSTAADAAGGNGVTALGDGNYLVGSGSWDNGAAADAGAVTFGSGTSGISGTISSANSLVGSAAVDLIGGSGSITALGNGNYVVNSTSWDNGATNSAGAVTLGLSNGSVVGPITSAHSVLGTVANQGFSHTFSYDPMRNQLAVGQPASNRVVLQRTGIATTILIVGDTPDPSFVGQPVTFTARVTASPNAPTDGQVNFRAIGGESCVDATPTVTSATTAEFSCVMVFTIPATTAVSAEYLGSINHAYGGFDFEVHNVEGILFADGYEGP